MHTTSGRILTGLAILSMTAGVAAQLASRPADEWIKTLDGETRVSALRIDDVVAALKLRPGQTVADIGAGSGLLVVQLARVVGPTGRVFAVEIDEGFFRAIRERAAAGQVTNVQTVLGRFTDPALPSRSVDLAVFHDVLHHVEDRAAYLKTVVGYLAPGGRIAVVDYEGGKGPHAADPSLGVTRAQLAGWMTAAGMTQVDDVSLFPDKFVLVFARR